MLDFSEIKLGSKKMNNTIEEISCKDIAVIGIAVKLSKAETVDELWQNLKAGVDCVGEIPEERKKDITAYLDFISTGESQKTIGQAAFIKEVDKFDYGFFKLSPKEAGLMDPNQRLFLEVAWKAIQDAGYGGNKIKDTNTGIFLGCGADCDYKEMISKVEPQSISVAAVGNLRPVIAGRISYILNLKGPTMLIDTTCSSSLVAVHLACRSLINRECDMAIAGGIQLHILPVKQTDIGTSSSDGRTKTFDFDSDGTGTGEGVLAVILKPLSKAILDMDNIYAVIKGSAINSDGSSLGLTAPSASAQESVIIKAWEDAGINPETISYIEAHGTGTRLGDPIEIEGIKKAFGRFTNRTGFCAVGSAKSNYGHLDSAAGILGFVKAVLSLKHKTIPKNLHFNKPNAEIDFIDSPVYVADKTAEWERSGDKRRCGVSSFGISGTNSHIVLEEAPELREHKVFQDSETGVFTVSARSQTALKTLVAQYIGYLEACKAEDFHSICYTANTGREHYNYRLSVLADSLDELLLRLNFFLNSGAYSFENAYIYYGAYFMIDKDRPRTGVFDFTDKEIKEITNSAKTKMEEFLLNKNRQELLHELMELYTKGAEIEWERLYTGEGRRKISLPAYPFEKNRCWINIPHSAQSMVQSQDILYENVWIHDETCLETTDLLERGTVLVFGERCQLYNSIVKGLQESGDQLIQVFKGTEFKDLGKNSYECVNTRGGYEKLLEVLSCENITRVLYLTPREKEIEINSPEQFESNLDDGLYAFFRFTAAFARKFAGQRVEFVLVSRPVNEIIGHEDIYPDDSAITGVGMVLPFEYPGFSSRCIELDKETPYANIIKEIRSQKKYFKVAYRKGKRYVEQLQSIQKDMVQKSNIYFKENGTYVITGGLGDIGTKLAVHVAKRHNANIILIGRTKLPEREYWKDIVSNGRDTVLSGKLEAMEKLEKFSCKVAYYTADISLERELSEVLEAIRNKHGKINGIIHCAGVGANMTGRIIGEETEETFREVLKPKLRGTWLLDKLTRKDNLDFFIMFSSAITLIGGRGSSHYTAANCYLDAYSFKRKTSVTKYMALDWAPWYRSDSIGDKKTFEEKHIFKVLPQAAALKAFDETICLNLPKVIAGELNMDAALFKLEDFLPFNFSSELKEKIDAHQKKTILPEKSHKQELTLTGKSSGEYSEAERKIAGIWGSVLGYKQLSIYNNFFEMGGDSILAASIHERLKKEFSQNISIADIFAYPTIAKMAEYISGFESKKPSKSTQLDLNKENNINENIFDLFDMVSKGEMSIDNALDRLSSMEDQNG
ncbi:type I polyketide synthase [Ruminiclostridium cellulolyticum]|uniref:Beta-ketoacyl synthase n=1 Tax=Ruminiclostridium cellulolyticum (strain ATCC 35319 / DSM 5812 / JCM 6584 / H10) TaxID=394503 RepID=B8I5I2_RUMCH|nr:type I polyketide synthase [Ruminiclostridium cellulolyticum]ACL76718.1 Beta-ketoacyl synthase [Ruminiclostridium cellulolyticum H10]